MGLILILTLGLAGCSSLDLNNNSTNCTKRVSCQKDKNICVTYYEGSCQFDDDILMKGNRYDRYNKY